MNSMKDPHLLTFCADDFLLFVRVLRETATMTTLHTFMVFHNFHTLIIHFAIDIDWQKCLSRESTNSCNIYGNPYMKTQKTA